MCELQFSRSKRTGAHSWWNRSIFDPSKCTHHPSANREDVTRLGANVSRLTSELLQFCFVSSLQVMSSHLARHGVTYHLHHVTTVAMYRRCSNWVPFHPHAALCWRGSTVRHVSTYLRCLCSNVLQCLSYVKFWASNSKFSMFGDHLKLGLNCHFGRFRPLKSPLAGLRFEGRV
jgi:hypothetical protein